MPKQPDDRPRTIYGLIDPRDGRVRYVGATTNPAARLRGHYLATAYRQPNGDALRSRRIDWLRDVIDAGLMPDLVELDSVAGAAWEADEDAWIDWLRAEGHDLTNG